MLLCPVTYIKLPAATRLIAAACAVALGFVYIMQYGFGLQPCELCLWQRLPFALAFLAALLALIWKPYGRQTAGLLGLCVMIFAVGAGLALFHSGVERHWWAGLSGCSGAALNSHSIDDLRKQLLQTPVVRCDQIAWTFLGLSMANGNLVFSTLLAIFAACAARHQYRLFKA